MAQLKKMVYRDQGTPMNIIYKIFTAVTMKNAVFWDVAPCRSYVNQRFGGIYCLHLQGRKIRKRGTSVNACLQS
jgi:hypothetical protein